MSVRALLGAIKPRWRAGDWVEVRSAPEILATLDESGRMAGMPFMPEMLQYCGKRFRVASSAHKGCDTIGSYTNRRIEDAVHLADVRCDGSAHDGCQQGCLMWWKSAWLKPVDGGTAQAAPPAPPADAETARRIEALQRQTRAPAGESDAAGIRYCCQNTELLAFSEWMRWWDPRQYLKDLLSGNVKPGTFIRYALIAGFNAVWRRVSRNPMHPYKSGTARGKLPDDSLNLQPGELVQVRSRDEILKTLDGKRGYLGLSFDVEMEPFCGKTYRVLRRVERLIDERTGRMVRIKRDCIVLEGVTCGGCLSRNRMFCPRAIYPYWRELWLRRVS